jgi:putative glutamine amidotransferase
LPTVALLVGREPALRISMHRGYADAIWAVGATPVILAPPPFESGLDRYVAAALACDAVCVTGGGDVAIEPVEGLLDPDPLRDAVETATVRAFCDSSKPVLGICRGIQMVSVALGGVLYRDLPTAGFSGHWDEERQHEPIHAVTASPGSLAARGLGGAAMVNSIHHQAVRDPGPRLIATAWSQDGIIEAVEAPGVLGVQWHPERLALSDERHLEPFRWLVAA